LAPGRLARLHGPNTTRMAPRWRLDGAECAQPAVPQAPSESEPWNGAGRMLPSRGVEQRPPWSAHAPHWRAAASRWTAAASRWTAPASPHHAVASRAATRSLLGPTSTASMSSPDDRGLRLNCGTCEACSTAAQRDFATRSPERNANGRQARSAGLVHEGGDGCYQARLLMADGARSLMAITECARGLPTSAMSSLGRTETWLDSSPSKLQDAAEHVALDQLALLACGGARCGGGEPVDVAQGWSPRPLGGCRSYIRDRSPGCRNSVANILLNG